MSTDGAAKYIEYPIRSDKLSMRAEIGEQIACVQSDFQLIEIFETPAFGRMLFLDKHVQLAELDERAYHESLVHVPMLNIRNPKRALIIGGGDGGVLREVLRHSSVERVDIVEIDPEVIEVCRRQLPFLNAGVFEDSRVQLTIGDAFDFVQSPRESYDLIVVDCTDVYEEENGALSEQLFTESFYRRLLEMTSQEGFVVTQADNFVFCPYSLDAIRKSFAKVFPKTGDYFAVVPSFGGFSAFCWGSKDPVVRPRWTDLRADPGELSYLGSEAYDFGQSKLTFVDIK